MHTMTYEEYQRKMIDINIKRNQIKEEHNKSLKLRQSIREKKPMSTRSISLPVIEETTQKATPAREDHGLTLPQLKTAKRRESK